MNKNSFKPDLSKITIIIPTFNRHFLLKRSLNYYSNFNINVIVLNSSKKILNIKNIKI